MEFQYRLSLAQNRLINRLITESNLSVCKRKPLPYYLQAHHRHPAHQAELKVSIYGHSSPFWVLFWKS